jgi:thiamine biosynthesis protein ThiS
VSTIVVTVNGVPHTIANPSTLEQLLSALRPPDERGLPMASAVNGLHVPQQARPRHILNDRDSITTFEPITGG